MPIMGQTLKGEGRRIGNAGQSGLYSKFKASLGYMM
jgi:hypothetical protein